MPPVGPTHAIIQQAGREMQIRCRHGAGIRILGFVDSVDDPSAYTGLGEVLLHRTGAWKLLSNAPLDPERELARVREVLRDYLASIDEGDAEFKERCDFIKANSVLPDENNDAPAVKGYDEVVTATVAPPGTPANPPVRPHHELRGQRYAVMGIVNHGGTSIVLPLGARETEDACREWIKGTLADAYPKFDLMCVQMYEWLYPYTLCDRRCTAEIPFTYGGPGGERLTELMQYQVDEGSKSEAFSTAMEASGVEKDRYLTELAA